MVVYKCIIRVLEVGQREHLDDVDWLLFYFLKETLMGTILLFVIIQLFKYKKRSNLHVTYV